MQAPVYIYFVRHANPFVACKGQSRHKRAVAAPLLCPEESATAKLQ